MGKDMGKWTKVTESPIFHGKHEPKAVEGHKGACIWHGTAHSRGPWRQQVDEWKSGHAMVMEHSASGKFAAPVTGGYPPNIPWNPQFWQVKYG